jgi:dipeptidyl-peptidase 4
MQLQQATRRRRGFSTFLRLQPVLICFGLWAFQGCFRAQAEAPDYERAQNLRPRLENKVFRDRVQPRWQPDNNQFWYRVKTGPNTHEFIWVDAEKGERRAAFDHQRLAEALTKASGKPAEAGKLAIDGLEFSAPNHSMTFRFGGKHWLFDLASYELREQTGGSNGNSLALLETPHPSARTGEETSLTFINHSESEVEIFWIDSDGERRSYGKVAPGGEREQHTFSGHVWTAAGRDGKDIAICEAEDKPGQVEIGAGGVAQKSRSQEHRREKRKGPQAAPGNPSPDGKWRAMIKDHNVVIQNSQTQEEIKLSINGTADDPYVDRFFWAPDSRHLVAIRNRPGEEHKVYFVESSPKAQLQPKLHTIDYLKPGDRIDHPRPQLFDLASKQQIPVSDTSFPNPWSIGEEQWSPDSREFIFLYNQRGHQVLRVLAIDAASGAVRTVVEETSPTFIDYNEKMYLHRTENGELLWLSERDGWNHLYLYDAATGKVKNQITRGEWVVRHVDRVDDQRRQIWFRAGGIRPGQDPYYLHYCRVNFDGGDLVILTEGDGTHSAEFAPDNRWLVDSWSRVDAPPVTELRRAADGKLICELEKASADELLKAGWRAPERFVAKGRDGVTDIYGVIVRPTNYDPAKKYPVIENIYAGPHSAFAPKRFSAIMGMQELAEIGFIVVQIDGMGTSYRSKKFHDVCWKNIGDAGFPDRILWLKAAAQKDPAMDLGRVGLYGTSAGGQNALRGLLAHGDFYRAGVADCGCHDNRMDKIWWNELWMGWPVGPHYDEQSNVTQAGKLQGKLLLMVGEMDSNVDPASTMQVVNALIKANKDFEMLVVPGAGHGVAGSEYGKRRLQHFFARHLLGQE